MQHVRSLPSAEQDACPLTESLSQLDDMDAVLARTIRGDLVGEHGPQVVPQRVRDLGVDAKQGELFAVLGYQDGEELRHGIWSGKQEYKSRGLACSYDQQSRIPGE